MRDLWYKNAVIYCLDVDTFMDSDGDGIGDFQGLADRLDHLEALGVTCIWLMPFYPSPNRDNGYDITDFYSVDPRLGTLGNFVNFTHAARDRGMRIIVDLVVNHTSIDHPWFQQARASRESKYRNWYVWSDEKPRDMHEGVVFPGVQDTVWSYDEIAGAWYLHRFYEHQADLNIANPAVREEIDNVMGFWLALGVSGFRIDAVPFLIEYKGVPDDQRPKDDPHCYLTDMRDFISWRRAEGVMLAEANITLDKTDEYFGRGDRLHMVFNFLQNQHLFLSLVREDAGPISQILEKSPAIPPSAQWATFLRNHDELDLGRLSDSERKEVFDALGPDPEMQVYGRGIRRRLAPMLKGNLQQLKLAYSLMFALPGTPVIYYGDEIGMGEDLSLSERNSVRTPMQWSEELNGGFSTASPNDLIRPVLADGPFGFEQVNVAAQQNRPGSLMEHIQELVRIRRSCPEIGWGEFQLQETGEAGVLALRYHWRDGAVMTVHNLSGREATVRLEDGGADVRPLFGGEDRSPHRFEEPIRLEPYGWRWYRLQGVRR